MGNHEQNRSRLRRIGLAALVVVLGVGVWQGVAGATATSGKVIRIQHHNGNCGRSIGTPFIGTATFSRAGDAVDVRVDLMSAEPNLEFDIALYAVKPDGDCKFLGLMDSLGSSLLTTDGNGQAKGHFELTGVDPKSQTFFMDAEGDNGFANDSLIVKLKA